MHFIKLPELNIRSCIFPISTCHKRINIHSLVITNFLKHRYYSQTRVSFKKQKEEKKAKMHDSKVEHRGTSTAANMAPCSFESATGRKRRKSGTTPYLHIKKAIRRTRLCKRRRRLRVPAGDEKNSEIPALINLLSGTGQRRRGRHWRDIRGVKLFKPRIKRGGMRI